MISAAQALAYTSSHVVKSSPIKSIDLEDGMPKVEEARLRMQRELQIAQQQGLCAVKLIHGYGRAASAARSGQSEHIRLSLSGGDFRTGRDVGNGGWPGQRVH